MATKTGKLEKLGKYLHGLGSRTKADVASGWIYEDDDFSPSKFFVMPQNCNLKEAASDGLNTTTEAAFAWLIVRGKRTLHQ